MSVPLVAIAGGLMVNPFTATLIVVAFVLVCVMLPEYGPAAPAFSLTLIFVFATTPLIGTRDKGEAFVNQVVPPSAEISKLTGGTIIRLLVKLLPETV